MKLAVFKRMMFLGWLALAPFPVVLWYIPYSGFTFHVLTWALALLILAGLLLFSWRIRPVRWLLLAVYAAVAVFLAFPSHRAVDRPALRDDYCAAMKAYLGTHYVWGGESCFGIDCSGLVQKGMIDALAARGVSTLDPGLVRAGLSLYWHRTTAHVLGSGYDGRTVTVTECPSLNALDYSLLQPGDLAVPMVRDLVGVHVLAYLGNKKWIASDPDDGGVTQYTIPEPKNPYFSMPMRIVRWTILQDG